MGKMKSLEGVEPVTDGGGIQTVWGKSWVWRRGENVGIAENGKRTDYAEVGKTTVGGFGIFQEHNNGMFFGKEANVKKGDTVNKS